jgi:hypothetical protein
MIVSVIEPSRDREGANFGSYATARRR